MIAGKTKLNSMRRIQLPVAHTQQTMAQYTDDTSLTLLGEEGSVQNAIYLKHFV